MGVDNVVACGFEFAAFFVVDYFIDLVGHAGIMYIALVGFAVRFVVYASIRNPWTVLPVEALQGSLSSHLSICLLVYYGQPATSCRKIKFSADSL